MASVPTGDSVGEQPEGGAPLAGRKGFLGLGGFWVAVIVLCVVGAVAAAVLLSGLSSIGDHNSQDAERGDALAAAQRYVLAIDAVDPRNVAASKAVIEPLLTTKAKTAFDQQTDQWSQMAQQLQQATASASATPSASASPSASPSGIVRYSAISTISTDSATALVADDAGIPSVNRVVPYRWEIQLRKVGGKWLVDDVQRIQ